MRMLSGAAALPVASSRASGRINAAARAPLVTAATLRNLRRSVDMMLRLGGKVHRCAREATGRAMLGEVVECPGRAHSSLFSYLPRDFGGADRRQHRRLFQQ